MEELKQGAIVLPKFGGVFEQMLKNITGKETNLMWKAGRPYVVISHCASMGTVLLVPQRTLYTANVTDRIYYEDDRHFLREIVWWQIMSADIGDLFDTGHCVTKSSAIAETLKRIQGRLFGESYKEPVDDLISEFLFKDGRSEPVNIKKSEETPPPVDVIKVPDPTPVVIKKPEPKPEEPAEPEVVEEAKPKRKHKHDREPIVADIRAGMPKRDVMQKHDISYSTYNRICKEYDLVSSDPTNMPVPQAEKFVLGSVIDYKIPNLRKVPDGVRKQVKNAVIIVQDSLHMNPEAILAKYKSPAELERQVKRAKDLLSRYHIAVE
ncbi:MAG: hypothetical protein J6Y02_14765 [Pseudobutyrivibrio sp.]|nr:hypothetical protein [Pseudobutyrivibrio sp.]